MVRRTPGFCQVVELLLHRELDTGTLGAGLRAAAGAGHIQVRLCGGRQLVASESSGVAVLPNMIST